ncbi:hypothetical protein B0T19DRAFT_407183 [Cercophora scortea]|uniref:Uncharacterized protein n=1 Tax=Cercophora scortea TaxID=314031 RepID=A0AAE0J2G7_9PEZI|nr:hypothetical protein B0T19DRAFT_407183 [Cercophora scortea]
MGGRIYPKAFFLHVSGTCFLFVFCRGVSVVAAILRKPRSYLACLTDSLNGTLQDIEGIYGLSSHLRYSSLSTVRGNRDVARSGVSKSKIINRRITKSIKDIRDTRR